MGPNARLRLIRDRFIAAHENYALRRHLDSVPPETPIRDIVDRCIVWESHANSDTRRIVRLMPERAWPAYMVNTQACVPEDQVVAAVAAPPVGLGDIEALLRHLLPTVPVQTPPPRAVSMEMEIMLERLLSNAPAPPPRTATSNHNYRNGNLTAAPASGSADSGTAPGSGS